MRKVAERGGIDSPLAVDGIAVTAACFAVLAPFVSRRGRRAGPRPGRTAPGRSRSRQHDLRDEQLRRKPEGRLRR